MVVLFDMANEITLFQMELVRLVNQDYDLDNILNRYLDYVRDGDVDLRGYRFKSGELINEDAEILYLYTKQLYRQMDKILCNIRRPIKNIRLTTNRQSILVETF